MLSRIDEGFKIIADHTDITGSMVHLDNAIEVAHKYYRENNWTQAIAEYEKLIDEAKKISKCEYEPRIYNWLIRTYRWLLSAYQNQDKLNQLPDDPNRHAALKEEIKVAHEKLKATAEELNATINKWREQTVLEQDEMKKSVQNISEVRQRLDKLKEECSYPAVVKKASAESSYSPRHFKKPKVVSVEETDAQTNSSHYSLRSRKA